jgi:hypothetical protein
MISHVHLRRALSGVIALSMSGALFGQAQATAPLTQYLTPRVDTVAATASAGDQVVPFGTAYRTVRAVRHAGKASLQITFRFVGKNEIRRADTIWVDPASLAPFESRLHNGVFDAVTVFEGSAIHTRITPHGQAEHRIDTTVVGTLYSAEEYTELILTAPLANGYQHTYDLYYGIPGYQVRRGTFRVLRTESVADRHGSVVDCWVVEAVLAEGLNQVYISVDDRRLVRVVNNADPRATIVFNW